MVIRASKRGMVIPDICELFDLPESEVKAILGTIDTE